MRHCVRRYQMQCLLGRSALARRGGGAGKFHSLMLGGGGAALLPRARSLHTLRQWFTETLLIVLNNVM